MRCHFEYARPIPFPSLSVPRQDGGMQLHIKCSRMLAPRFLTHKTPNSKTLQTVFERETISGVFLVGGCLNMHDLFPFRVFERPDTIVVCARPDAA